MTSLAHAPRFSLDDAAALALAHFGLRARAEALPSERDQNFRLVAADGARFVLKIANAAESRAVLDAENAVMHRLAPLGLTPRLIPAQSGADVIEHAGHFVRLISHIDGVALGDALASPELLRDLGRALARVDRALQGFDHPALHRDFHWDLARAADVVAQRRPLVRDAALTGPLDALVGVYHAYVAPLLPALRTGVVHGDANDYNVLVALHESRIAGLVDFGDMVHSHLVNDLAIAMAYAVLGKADPLAAAAEVLRGFHAEFPLQENEIAALFGLMCMRLCVSACMAAEQQAARPDDAYLGISQAPIRAALPKLAAIHPRLAHYVLRDACGLPPVPHAPAVVEWLRARTGSFAHLTGHDLQRIAVYGLDLSAGSPIVSSNPADNAAEPFTRRVFERMREAGAVVAVGGYDEPRLIYSTDVYATGKVTDERRTVHMAVDLTLPAGAPLFAPLDGIVHGFENATDRLDYGPVIVLRHEQGPAVFYTLYGHLSAESLDGLYVGKSIAQGERFAALGAPPVNGDWWPHVHFQIITDMLDIPCNFNGVALNSQRSTWRSISPDPNLILNCPVDALPKQRSKDELLASRRAHIGGNLSISYRKNPLNIVRGWKQYLFDETGRTFIDAYNNVPHVGHSHPRVVRAVSEQLAVLNTNTRYLQDQLTIYAEELTALLPSPLRVCFFTASGSEANELAIRLARAYTERRDLIVMDAAYHGHTSTLIDISPYKHDGPGGRGAPDWVHTSPIPDVYRGEFRLPAQFSNGATYQTSRDQAMQQAGLQYAARVGEVIDRVQAAGRGLCGYIAETCPSVGGQMLLPPGFLADVYRRVRTAGGVCIADEVQTGFGRIGTHFWAFEAHDVTPDIVVLGKPIANGYPMGAVITTPEIAAAFDNGMEFFSTFGGSTAACAAALATLRVTREENLQAHALRVGDTLLAGLRALAPRHPLIGDVRGSGLFLGVELVRDHATLEPAADEASAVALYMRERGVLLGTDGPFHNVVKLRGPMPLAESDVDCIVEAFEQALKKLKK
jgi:4-aminobutyrate aminotransferase-like enzyme/Ser/Thr protein kinase RdoA (MazF antagonist)